MEDKGLDLSGLLGEKVYEITVIDDECTNRNGYVIKFLTDIVPNVGECLWIRGCWWDVVTKGYGIDEEQEDNEDLPVLTDVYLFCKKQVPPL